MFGLVILRAQLIKDTQRSLDHLKHITNKFETRIKGTVENWVKYWKTVYNDYRDVALNVKTNIKEKPLKAFVIFSRIGLSVASAKNNPNFDDFRDQYMRWSHRMILVHPNLQNTKALQHLRFTEMCYNQLLIRTLNFVYSSSCQNYDSNSPYLKVQYSKFKDLDIGFLTDGFTPKRCYAFLKAIEANVPDKIKRTAIRDPTRDDDKLCLICPRTWDNVESSYDQEENLDPFHVVPSMYPDACGPIINQNAFEAENIQLYPLLQVNASIHEYATYTQPNEIDHLQVFAPRPIISPEPEIHEPHQGVDTANLIAYDECNMLVTPENIVSNSTSAVSLLIPYQNYTESPLEAVNADTFDVPHLIPYQTSAESLVEPAVNIGTFEASHLIAYQNYVESHYGRSS